MPEDDLVVANTSPLLNLALIDRLDLLEAQFPSVVVPEQVWEELASGEEGFDAISATRDDGFLAVDRIETRELYVEIGHELDDGEAAAITYAIENDADLTLLDEREGRRAARRHGLNVTGVIGILLRGERDGTVELRSELDALREEGFWIAEELYREALEASGESVD